MVDEREVRRQTLLTESATLLASSLEDAAWYLQGIAELAVPTFADWCVVESVRDDGSFHVVAEAHAGARGHGLAAELRRRRPCTIDSPSIVSTAARTQRGRLVVDVADVGAKRLAAPSDELRAYVELGVTSAMVVPVITAPRVELVLCMFSLSPMRRFDLDDLEVVRRLACSITASLEHARRFSHADEVLRASSNLVADAAGHELRTPLSALLLQLEKLQLTVQRQPPLDVGGIRKSVDRALGQAKRLRQAVEKLILRRHR